MERAIYFPMPVRKPPAPRKGRHVWVLEYPGRSECSRCGRLRTAHREGPFRFRFVYWEEGKRVSKTWFCRRAR